MLPEEDLKTVYNWVDEFQLSRPKRNISRDFSDAVLCAEIVYTYCPNLVELHNYAAVNSVKQKEYNWKTLYSRKA
jgi:CH-like domain in sperm protein